MIENVIIRNFRSIRSAEVRLGSLNVLIGSNGVGKSNFIAFFEFVQSIFKQRLGGYTLEKGGIDALLYNGRRVSSSISGLIDFANTNAFFFEVKPMPSSKGYLSMTGDFFNTHRDNEKRYSQTWHRTFWDSNVEESNLVTRREYRAGYLKKYLNSFTVYHFHDTSSSSPMRGACNVSDNASLRDNGSNLAAYLYKLQNTDEKAFKLIEGTIRSIAPYFKGFALREEPVGQIQLEWEEVDSDMYLNGYSISDGTLRFIALATLLLQTKLPEVIIIDEPELGLHPAAINKLAALLNKAAVKSQVIISTQSTNLVNGFDVDDIIVVDREDNQTIFQRLDSERLAQWLDEYTVSELWEKNVIGGQV